MAAVILKEPSPTREDFDICSPIPVVGRPESTPPPIYAGSHLRLHAPRKPSRSKRDHTYYSRDRDTNPFRKQSKDDGYYRDYDSDEDDSFLFATAERNVTSPPPPPEKKKRFKYVSPSDYPRSPSYGPVPWNQPSSIEDEYKTESEDELCSPQRASSQRHAAIDRWYSSLKKPQCADCDSRKGLEWVVFPWGVMICRDCAICHRKLRITSIKNLYTDNIAVDRLRKASKAKANGKLEKFLQPWRKPREDTSSVIRERFIRDKYDKMLFMDTDQAKAFSSKNKHVWKLVKFLEKFADPKKEYFDPQSITETLEILLEGALEDQTFSDSFLELFVRLGWSTTHPYGFEDGAIQKRDIVRLYQIITDKGYFFGMRAQAREVNTQRQAPKQIEQETLAYKPRPVSSNTQVQARQNYSGSPHSRKIPGKAASSISARYRKTSDSEFKVKIYGEGLGMGISCHDRWGGAEVSWVEPNSEAWSVGVRKGDVILEVNYTNVTKKRTEFIRELIDEARPLSMRLKRKPSSP